MELENIVEAENQNNRLELNVSHHPPKARLSIPPIGQGIVIDHIEAGKSLEILEALNLGETEGLVGFYLPSGRRGKKDFIKIVGKKLDDRMTKIAVMISPNSTLNVIESGRVVKKIKEIVCENPHCETRDLEKNIPPVFYIDDTGQIKCEYCNTVYERDFDGRQRYITALKGDKYFGSAVEEIKTRLKELKERVVLSVEEYEKILADKDSEFTEEQRSHLKEVEDLAYRVHEYVLESFFFIGYDQDRRCSSDAINKSLRERLENCGLDTWNTPQKSSFSANRLIRPVEAYGIQHFLRDVEDNLLELIPDAEEKKDEIIGQYKAGFKATPYIVSNMLRAIDGARID